MCRYPNIDLGDDAGVVITDMHLVDREEEAIRLSDFFAILSIGYLE